MSDLKPQPPPSNSALKNILIWGIFVMMFVSVYSMFTPEPNGAKPANEMPVAWIVAGVLGAALVGVCTWGVIYNRAAKRFNTINVEAVAALQRGEHARARSVYERFVGERPKAVAQAATHNVAWSLMREGEVRKSLEMLVANDRTLAVTSHLRTITAIDATLTAALVGELEVARAWLAECEVRRKTYNEPGFEATVAFARAVIECRDGKPAEAVRVLADSWTAFETGAKGEILRPLRVVRAFAIGAETTRNAGMAEATLELSKPHYPDEFSFLGAEWPEMKMFLAAHTLG